jgi:hypothetical protein
LLLAYSATLKKEAVRSTVASIYFDQSTWRYVPEVASFTFTREALLSFCIKALHNGGHPGLFGTAAGYGLNG